jgi:hypothetical protein
VCVACRRRGAPCIAQDQPEEHSHIQALAEGNRDPLLHRMHRVETLLERLVAHVVPNAAPPRTGLLTPTKSSRHLTPSRDLQLGNLDKSRSEPSSMAGSLAFCMDEESRRISEELTKAFPSQQDIDIICKADYLATVRKTPSTRYCACFPKQYADFLGVTLRETIINENTILASCC